MFAHVVVLEHPSARATLVSVEAWRKCAGSLSSQSPCVQLLYNREETTMKASFLVTACLLFVTTGCSGQLQETYRRDSLLSATSWATSATPFIVTLDNRTNCAPGDTEPPNRVDTSVRVDDLIAELNSNDYNAYIVPTSDDHQSEYAPERDRRREYISGFSGSAGYALVLSDGQRALWTDGRYFLQADDELDCQWLFMKETMAGVPTLLEFLKDNLSSGDVVAADPSLLGYGNWNGLAKGLSESGISLVASSTNLVDTVWDADSDNPRPAYGKDSAYPHSIEYAGLTIEEKLSNVRAAMASGGAQALVISTLDETAWLYNVRGNDIVYNPVVRSYAIVQEDDATWYLDLDKITPEIEDHLGDLVTIAAYDEIWDALADLSSNPLINTIMLPDDSLSSGCSFKLYDTVLESKRWMVVTPTLKMKAQKNSVEISRMKEALIMDGVALSDFLAELERQMGAGEVPTEVTAQELLKTYRLSQKDCTELSFATISGYAEHGAIMHYEATNLTSVPIETDSLYLLDSGGQYLGGTTDITRTMHYGTPTAEMIEMYTLVLMGMIDFITLTFPSSMSRWDMEVLPRRPLYAKGLNYRHSSSHGIGMYLFVHEVVEVQVKPGYVLSNEPGFYKDGAWGVRIENQMLVVDTGMFFDEPFYTFEALSLVPYEPKLIDVALLTHYQANWLNAYNLEVREKVGQELLNQGRLEGYEWLLTKTEPIGISSATVPNPTLLPVIAVTLFTLIKGLYFTN